jgi:two-component system, chemotaxis family, sensor kinase CheA
MIDKFRDNFRDEAYELLNNLEGSLLALEENPNDKEQISAVFRIMHTVKGSAAMFGFINVSHVAHEIESLLEHVRNGEAPVTGELIDLTLEARDHLRVLMEHPEDIPNELKNQSEDIISRFSDLMNSLIQVKPTVSGPGTVQPENTGMIGGGDSTAQVEQAPAEDTPPASDGDDSGEHLRTFRIHFKPHPQIFANGTNPLLLVKELSELGEATSIPYLEKIPRLSELSSDTCYVYWDVLLTTRSSVNEIRDVFMFVEDDCDITVEIIDNLDEIEGAPHKRIGEILKERGFIDEASLEVAIRKQKRLGEMLVEQGVPAWQVEAAVAEQQHLEKSRKKVETETAGTTIRVGSEKLDTLVDLVGELVTLQARLSRTAGQIQNNGLSTISETLDRLTSELRDSTMSVRMLPIGTTFRKFKRLVRDLCQDLGKEAEISMSGEETELDKTVIEKLNDPLVHIIRNAMDHGIETPDIRQKAGKPRTGSISLSATHSGANVLIEITDDGAGLDKGKILARAQERGLVASGADIPEDEVLLLVFAPGFSTKENISSLSGRGVGMDVVKKQIESLGGQVKVASEPGQGTRITMAIPLTLAIIEGLLVRLGNDHFVFPLSMVMECLEFRSEDQKHKEGRRFISNRGEILPFVDLRSVFDVSGEEPSLRQIVVTAVNQTDSIGFVVDTVIGDHQTVIKTLGKLYRDTEGVSGATILGDGSVALILDVHKLSQIASRMESHSGV